MTITKRDLYLRGVERVLAFLGANPTVDPVHVVETDSPTTFGTCAYYRSNVIYIHVPACANVGYRANAWSWPGYIVDRTPFGVLCHELGHHVDKAHGRWGGVMSHEWRTETQDEKITNYCPNDNEWFAEIFRLYLTNPDLLRRIRPRVYAKLAAEFVTPEVRRYDAVGLPERQLNAAKNKIKQSHIHYKKMGWETKMQGELYVR